MSKQLNYLKHRRALLVSQAALQRSEMPFVAQKLQQHLRLADMGLAIVKVVRKHPALMLAGATMLLPSGRSKLFLWTSRLFTSWELFALLRKQLRNGG